MHQETLPQVQVSKNHPKVPGAPELYIYLQTEAENISRCTLNNTMSASPSCLHLGCSNDMQALNPGRGAGGTGPPPQKSGSNNFF